MTVREYRKGESQGVADLWRRNPTLGGPLIGINPDAVAKVLVQTERPLARFALGLARLFHRPIFMVIIVDLDGHVMGTTLVTFSPEAIYISSVVVDAAVRRQGHAKAMLQAAEALGRKFHRPYAVLDVVAQNDAAIRLYDSWGYRPLREAGWLSRPFGPEAPPLPPVSGTTRIRPLQPTDGAALAAMDNALMSAEVRAIQPRHAGDFRPSSFDRSVLMTEADAWVAEVDGQPAGFLRASVNRAIEAGNLSSPLFRGDAPEMVMQDTIVTALRWLEARNVPRVVTEMADHQRHAKPVFDRLGFTEALQLHTMVHRLA